MSQGELFPRPGIPRPRLATPARAARYARRRVDTRWCDACIRDIHIRGFGYADPVRRATWVRLRSGEPPEVLCETHKAERQERER